MAFVEVMESEIDTDPQVEVISMARAPVVSIVLVPVFATPINGPAKPAEEPQQSSGSIL